MRLTSKNDPLASVMCQNHSVIAGVNKNASPFFLSFFFGQVKSGEEQTLVFTIPIFEPLPSQYYVRGVSDRWLGAEVVCALSFKHLILPERHPPHTELLDLQPLPVTALKCKEYELLYR